MDILNSKTLREKADQALRRGREPKKLIYTYAGITLAMSLAIYLATLWLDKQISGTGGLSNMGSRSILVTAQQAIQVLGVLAAMCLDLGFLGGLMRIARGQYADHTDMKVGFRKFWALIRLNLIQTLLYCAVGFLAIQVGSVIFTFTPWAGPLLEKLMPIYSSGTMEIPLEMATELLEMMAPLLAITGIVFVVMLIPFLFRMRMAFFFLLDDPRGRALAAIWESNRIMRRRFGQMLKIDLRLWLYYLAQVLVMLVLYTDYILVMLGIPFPMEAGLFAGVLFGVSLALQFMNQVFLRPAAEVTYLTVYDSLREKPADNGVVLGNIFDM